MLEAAPAKALRGGLPAWPPASRSVEPGESAPKLRERRPSNKDLFHANTLELFDGSAAHLSPLFARGNILTSFRRFSTIAIVDGESKKMVWTLAGEWVGQHTPTLLPDGNILLFDNQRYEDWSQALIVNPQSGEIVWRYKADPPSSFNTEGAGVSEPLPNGNVLLTESAAGRVFEVTPGGEIVWEYYNPARVGKSRELVAALFLCTRLPPDFPLDWLER